MIQLNSGNSILSEKQNECLALLKSGGLKRINILEGSVRSGKTYVSLILWGFWVASKPQDCTFLMAGKTLSTLKRNVLIPFQEIFGDSNFEFSTSSKEAMFFGRRIYLEGVGDVRSESKIRGLTLDGAYCDELSLFDEDFFIMLMSRLSKHGAKLFATTNPDHPNHWLKKNYLDNKSLDLLDLRFTLDDNIFLDREYVESLKKEYKGMYYDRFIKGLWVAAEGRIYPDIPKNLILGAKAMQTRLGHSPPVTVVAGVDYGGNKSASVFTLTGFTKGFREVYVLDEYYDSRNKSAEHLIEAFRTQIEKWRQEYPISAAYCDSAEQLLVKSFRSAVNVEVKNALKRPVNTRINMLGRLISSGRIFISSKCAHLIDAIETAVWDESKPNCDVRLDNGTSNIDSLDSFEYTIERFEKELFLRREKIR